MFLRERVGSRCTLALGPPLGPVIALLGVRRERIAEYETAGRMPPLDRLTEIMSTLGLDARIIFPEFFGPQSKPVQARKPSKVNAR